jgi:hypothetical protein
MMGMYENLLIAGEPSEYEKDPSPLSKNMFRNSVLHRVSHTAISGFRLKVI